MTDTPLAAAPALLTDDRRRFLASVLPSGAAAALQLVTFALTARALGPETFGLLAVVYATTVIASDVAGLGGDLAMVRTVALDPGHFPAAWGHALTLLALSLLPVAAVAAALAALATGLPASVVAMLALGEVLLGRATAATELAFVARGAPVAASLARLAATAARTLTAVAMFGLAGVTTLAPWAAASLAQSTVTAAGLLLATGHLHGHPRWQLARTEIRFGLLLMLNQASRAVSGNLDRILLAALLPPAGLGLYAAGTRLQLVSGLLTQAATRLYHPRFFRAAADGEAALARLARSVAARLAAVGVGAALIIAVGAQLLPLLLGPAYAAAAPVAAGLALAAPFTALQYPAADALTARGQQGARTAIFLGAALVSAALLAAGALAAGLPGAVAGFVAGQAATAAALWLAYRRLR